MDMITARPPEPHVWEHVEPVVSAFSEIIPAYRTLPAVTIGTPRPTVAENKNGRIIWLIPTESKIPAFMTASRTNCYNDRQYVVFIISADFYAMWRAVECCKGPNQPQRPPKLADIPSDRKWPGQDDCWRHGISNPVPLADVSFHPKYGIGFANGITRTLWLLHNKAPSFPVLVHSQESAMQLYAALGDQAMPCQNLEDLIQP